MTERSSADYYRSRERQERQIAAATVDRGIAAIHRELADRYSLMVSDPAPVQPLSLHCLQA